MMLLSRRHGKTSTQAGSRGLLSPRIQTHVVLAILFCQAGWDCRAADEVWPLPEWSTARPADVAMDEASLRAARDYALTGGGSGYITRHGKLVMSWGDPTARYDLKSTTKSIGVTALGLAIKDGKIGLNDKVTRHHPSFGILLTVVPACGTSLLAAENDIVAVGAEVQLLADGFKSFTFAQMCDTQLGFGGYEHDVNSFKQAVKQINALHPDFVVICGDLVNVANEKSFADFHKIKAGFTIPCYNACGNHDIGNKPSQTSLQNYRKVMGKDYYSFEHKRHTFVIVNTQLPKISHPLRRPNAGWDLAQFHSSMAIAITIDRLAGNRGHLP